MVHARALVFGSEQSIAFELDDSAGLSELKAAVNNQESQLKFFDVYWTTTHSGDWFCISHPDVGAIVKGDLTTLAQLTVTLQRISPFELVAPRLQQAQASGTLHVLVIPRMLTPRPVPWDCSKDQHQPQSKMIESKTSQVDFEAMDFETELLGFFLLLSLLVLLVGTISLGSS